MLSHVNIWLIWHFHDNVSSTVTPRNLISVALVMCLFNNVIFKSTFWPFLVQNWKKWVWSKFKDIKLLLNHLLISAKTVFTLVGNSTELGPVIIQLVSPAYNTNLAFLDVAIGKSCINNTRNKVPRTDHVWLVPNLNDYYYMHYYELQLSGISL